MTSMNPETHSACSALPSAPDSAGEPLRLESAWLGETALSIAKGIAAHMAFDRLPILADALEDAGCDNRPLLDHFRFGEPHQVDCWALRLLLHRTITLLLPGSVPMPFAWCPSGSFQMGSVHPKAVGNIDERPIHRVTLSRSFFAGIFPVTQAMWRAVMDSNPSHFNDPWQIHRPVENVSWNDAQAFCIRARERTGRAIRLPTEAEWEYACRAGTTTEYHFGDRITSLLANYDARDSWNGSQTGDCRRTTTTVGQFPANPWGLFDVHGNVWEWCEDWFHENTYQSHPTATIDPKGPIRKQTFRVCRGGCWDFNPSYCRSAYRFWYGPRSRSNLLGFRVVFCAD